MISNAAYNNPRVKGLVFIAAFAPDEGESEWTYVDPSIQYPKEFFVPDNGGCVYISTAMFREFMAQDIDPSEADIWAVVQNPMRQSDLKNLALLHGSSYQHGIRFLNTTICSLQKSSVPSLSK